MHQIKLTRREKEILNLLLEGLVPKEIAGKLEISYNTVISHQRRLYRKFNVHSIEELLEKHHDIKVEDVTPLSIKNWKKYLTPKYFIPLGAGIVLFILFFIILKPAKDPSLVYLEDGTYFTLHNFDDVHLRALKWVNIENDWYGEKYYSGERIRLNDFYNGTIDNLIPIPGNNNEYKFKLSGNIDKESKYTKIEILYFSHTDNRYIYIGGTDNDSVVSIGPGAFSAIFTFRHTGIDINTLPKPGVFYFIIHNEFLNVYNSFNYYYDTGERIPAHMPDQAIWATIHNLKIEPVDRLSRKK